MGETGKTAIYAAVQVGHSLVDYCSKDKKDRNIGKEIE
jgi:hypothetical protein